MQNLSWQEPVVHTPAHKDYMPDITNTENESDYREEDEAPGGPEDYEDDYQENGMQDKKKKKKWKIPLGFRARTKLMGHWNEKFLFGWGEKNWIYNTDFFLLFIVPI